MAVHIGILWLFSIGTVGLVILARHRLRANAPRVRMALGFTGILLAALILSGLFLMLPGPGESGFSNATDVASLAASIACGGLFVLSLNEIVGGAMRALMQRRSRGQDLGQP